MSGVLGAVAAIGVTRAALVPLHDGEVLFPGAVVGGLGPLGLAGSAMDHQQHRIAPVVASDVDPLIEAAQRNEGRLVDPHRRVLGVRAGASEQ